MKRYMWKSILKNNLKKLITQFLIISLIFYFLNFYLISYTFSQENIVDSYIQKAVTLYNQLDFEEALNILKSALEIPYLDKGKIAKIKVCLGALYIVLNEEEKGKTEFLGALSNNPKITLTYPFNAPKIEKIFKETQELFKKEIQLLDQESPKILFAPLTSEFMPNTRIDIEAYVTDNIGVQHTKLFYRKKGELKYLSEYMPSTGKDYYHTTIDASFVTSKGIEYYIEAIDEAGNISRIGKPEEPFLINVKKVTLPWYKKKFFWALTAVGAGVSAILYFNFKNNEKKYEGENKGVINIEKF